MRHVCSFVNPDWRKIRERETGGGDIYIRGRQLDPESSPPLHDSFLSLMLATVPARSAGHAGTAARLQPDVQPVEVIATHAAARDGVTLDQIPAPVQSATAADIEASGALDLSDFLNRRLTGVHVNEMQGNPFQADVNYRGYTASPLLGTPQGLSVYMDGVRLNQPFGDVVSWDLIPRMAIRRASLMPGSNPLFGLNTLGGALSLQTKDGRAIRALACRRATAATSAATSNSSTAAQRPRSATGISRAISSARTAGATIRRRTSARSSARSAGSAAKTTLSA